MVFVCESVPCVLMQHLPVLCALQGVPVAVIAASPEALGSAVAPLQRKPPLGATAPWAPFHLLRSMKGRLKKNLKKNLRRI